MRPRLPPSARLLQKPVKSSPTALRPTITTPPGRKKCTDGGYCAISRFQSHALSAARCSATTASGVGCRFSGGERGGGGGGRPPPPGAPGGGGGGGGPPPAGPGGEGGEGRGQRGGAPPPPPGGRAR